MGLYCFIMNFLKMRRTILWMANITPKFMQEYLLYIINYNLMCFMNMRL